MVMLTRTLATLTLLVALGGKAEPTIPSGAPSGANPDHAVAARRARLADDIGGCREPEPTPTPVAPVACGDEARP